MIFANELTSLESELSQLEMMLIAKRQQLGFFQNLQIQADECLERLSRVVNHAKENTASGAIASLKTAVLSLFTDGDGGNDDGLNQPTNPTPGVDDLEPELIAFNGETGDYLLSDGSTSVEDETPPLTYAQAIKNRCSACWGYEVTTKRDIKEGFVNRTDLNFMEAVNLERTGREFYRTVETYLNNLYYNGQSCKLEDCPESCLVGQHYQLASYLACQTWEDAPLTGQHCTIIPSTTEDNKNNSTKEGEDMPKPPSTEMVHLSANCGYLKAKWDGRILATYAWFSRKNIAESWLAYLSTIPAAQLELRESKRNTSWKWELKITGLSMPQIERLSKEALHHLPSKSKETPAQAAGIEPPSDWRKPQVKQELPPTELQTGSVLPGNRVITTGAYFGQGRRNAINLVLKKDDLEF